MANIKMSLRKDRTLDELLGWDRLIYGYARYGEPAVTRGSILTKIADDIGNQSFRFIPGSGKTKTFETVSQHAMSFNWKKNRVNWKILEEKI